MLKVLPAMSIATMLQFKKNSNATFTLSRRLSHTNIMRYCVYLRWIVFEKFEILINNTAHNFMLPIQELCLSPFVKVCKVSFSREADMGYYHGKSSREGHSGIQIWMKCMNGKLHYMTKSLLTPTHYTYRFLFFGLFFVFLKHAIPDLVSPLLL